MVRFIETELIQLKREIDRMWTLVHDQMEQAYGAVMNMDQKSARQIISREKKINAFELKIDSDVEDMIALYSPVAIDLRFVLAMLKINTNLERIGDYAAGIARFVQSSDAEKLDPQLVKDLKMEEMFSTILSMLETTQQALFQEDAEMAVLVMQQDTILDKIYADSLHVLARYCQSNIESIPLCLGLSAVFRKLERTGDHLTNIAEEIVFYLDAKVLKHINSGSKDKKE